MDQYGNYFYPGETVEGGVDSLQAVLFRTRLLTANKTATLQEENGSRDRKVTISVLLTYGDPERPWRQRMCALMKENNELGVLILNPVGGVVVSIDPKEIAELSELTVLEQDLL